MLKPKERKKGGNDELQVLSALTFFPRTSSPLDAKPLPRKMICVGVGDNRGRVFFSVTSEARSQLGRDVTGLTVDYESCDVKNYRNELS